MKPIVIAAMIACGAAGMVASSLGVETAGRNYQTIVDRNPFGLRDPVVTPPRSTIPPKVEPPKPKFEIKLTGLNTYGGRKKAYFYSKEPNAKNPYFNVAEGGAEQGIEVREINALERYVKVLMNGEEVKMSLKTHGLTNTPVIPPPQLGKPGQPGVMPPALGQPGQPIQPGQPGYGQPNTIPAPNMQPGNVFTPNNTPQTLPSRALRGQFNNAPNQTGNVLQDNPALAQRYGLAPTTPAAQPQVSPEEQFLRMKVNEELARRNNQPFPPLPVPQ